MSRCRTRTWTGHGVVPWIIWNSDYALYFGLYIIFLFIPLVTIFFFALVFLSHVYCFFVWIIIVSSFEFLCLKVFLSVYIWCRRFRIKNVSIEFDIFVIKIIYMLASYSHSSFLIKSTVFVYSSQEAMAGDLAIIKSVWVVHVRFPWCCERKMQ